MSDKDLALKIILGAEDKTGSAISGLKTNLGGVGQVVDGLKNKIVGLVGAYSGLTGLKNALNSITDTGGKFEQLSVQMSAVMGSIAGGEKATQWVKDFAKNTPFEVDGVSQAFVKLKAFGLDPMNGTMQAIADQTSKLGGGQQELEGIVLALGQAWTKQKLQAEEANQLIERGVPVWELLSKATGKTTSEITKMSEAGQLGRKEIQLLIDAMGQSSKGASTAMMQTWTGQISNLKDTWAQFLNSIANAGMLDYMKAKLSGFLEYVNVLASNGQLQAVAETVSGFFVGIGTGFENAGKFVMQLWPSVQTMWAQTKPIFDQILTTAGLLATPFVNLFTLLTGRGISDPATFGQAFQSVLRGIIDSVTPIVSAFNTGLTAISAAFYGLSGTIAQQIGGLVSDYAEFAKTLGLPFENADRLAQAFGASADENFKKAGSALDSTVESAQQTRDAFDQLGKGGDATAKTVDGVAKSSSDAAKATGDLATKVDQLPKEPKTIYVNADTHEYTDNINKIKEPTSSLHTIQAAQSVATAQQQIDQLKQPTESTHTVHIVEVKDNGTQDTGQGAAAQQATGGLAGHPAGKLWRFAAGGWARMAGLLSGYGGGDRRKALLEDGEYIVRKEAVKKLGVDTLNTINAGELPLQRSSGGGVNLDEEWRNQGIERLKKLLKESETQAVNRFYGWKFLGDPDQNSGMDGISKGNGFSAQMMTVAWIQREASKIAEKYGLGPDVLAQVERAAKSLPVVETLTGIGEHSTSNDNMRNRAERAYNDYEALSKNVGQNIPSMPALPSVSIPRMPAAVPAAASGQTITVRFIAPGQSASGQFNPGDIQHLLDTLKAAGARTA